MAARAKYPTQWRRARGHCCEPPLLIIVATTQDVVANALSVIRHKYPHPRYDEQPLHVILATRPPALCQCAVGYPAQAPAPVLSPSVVAWLDPHREAAIGQLRTQALAWRHVGGAAHHAAIGGAGDDGVTTRHGGERADRFQRAHHAAQT